MRGRWWLVATGLVLLAAAGCGEATRGAASTTPPSDPGASSAWGPPSFRYIPSDTPYLYASVNPPSSRTPDALQELWQHALTTFKAYLAKADSSSPPGATPGPTPGTQALLALIDEIVNDKARSWKAHLGLSEDLHYVVYGLSVWPVIRMDVADRSRLTAILERTWRAAHQQVQPISDGKATYWMFPDREETSIVIVTDRELVASTLPSALTQQALPYLLGTKLPPTSLAQAPSTPAVVRLLHTTKDNLGYVDLQQIANIVLGRSTGLNATLRGTASIEHDAELTPACVTDLDRLVALAPRVLWGVSRFDGHGVTGRLLVEVPRALRSALRALRTSFGGINLAEVRQAMFAMGGAVDVDGLIQWVRERASAVRASPFQCPQLAPINDAIATVDDALGVSWPEMLHGLRGGVFALSDFSMSPLRCEAFALLDGNNLGKLAALVSALPGRPFGTLSTDGKPVALPLPAAGIPLQTTGHVALTDTRAAVALGADSEAKSEQLLHTSASATPPLLFFRFDLPRFQALLAAINKPMESMPFQYRTMGAAIQTDEDGLRFDFNLTW